MRSALTADPTKRVAVVTGAGRGIGAETARVFCERGFSVAIASRSVSELEETARKIRTEVAGAAIIAVPTDVSDEVGVKTLFEATISAFGRVDVLINNAAVVSVEDFSESKVENWDFTWAVNVRGSYLCAREAFHAFRAQKSAGLILNVSSLAGIRGTEKFKGLASYVVSKHAVVGLTEALAVEGHEWGIRAYCMAPGAVDTEMLKKALPHLKTKTSPRDIAEIFYSFVEGKHSHDPSGTIFEVHSNA